MLPIGVAVAIGIDDFHREKGRIPEYMMTNR